MTNIKHARSKLRYFLSYGYSMDPIYAMGDMDQNCYVVYTPDGYDRPILAIIEKRFVIAHRGPFVDLFQSFAERHNRAFKTTSVPLMPPSNPIVWEAPNWETAPEPDVEEEPQNIPGYPSPSGLESIIDDRTYTVSMPVQGTPLSNISQSSSFEEMFLTAEGFDV